MRTLLIVVSLAALAGCKSEAEKAEAEYELVQGNISQPGDACRAASKAKDAWLAEGNKKKYEFWSLIAYSACLRV